MNSVNPAVDRRKPFQVSPSLLLGCCVALLVFLLPDAIRGRHGLQRLTLLLAALAVAAGWVLLIRYPRPSNKRRTLVALAAAVGATASLPVFLFEMSQTKWLMRHPQHHLFSMYVWPGRGQSGFNGYVPVLLILAGCFSGRGPARVAFIAGCILLLILRASMGTWVY
jgi:hypothetical protein